VIADDKSAMSMMEYSGDFGEIAGGSQRLLSRSFDLRSSSRSSSGVRCAVMSAAEGSNVSKTMPECMS
jgi:hypothetical protein